MSETQEISESTDAAPAAAPKKKGLRARALLASAWTLFSLLSRNGLRLASNLILTRILFPEAFGVMAIVNAVHAGLMLFSDFGIGASIVQNKRAEESEFLDTAWTIQVLRGFALWLCTAILAWPVAQFYNEPQLFYLIPISGFSAVIAGFNSTSIFLLQRHLKQGTRTAIELANQVVTLLVTIALAYHYRAVWTLAVGPLAGVLVTLVWSHLLAESPRQTM